MNAEILDTKVGEKKKPRGELAVRTNWKNPWAVPQALLYFFERRNG